MPVSSLSIFAVGAFALLLSHSIFTENVHADDEPLWQERPWAAGVSDAAQATARDLYARAHEAAREGRWQDARSVSMQALGHWDHPTLHALLARVCLVLDDEACITRHAWLALRHGGAPLALSELDALKRIEEHGATLAAVLEIRSESPVDVELDGRRVATKVQHFQYLLDPDDYRVEEQGGLVKVFSNPTKFEANLRLLVGALGIVYLNEVDGLHVRIESRRTDVDSVRALELATVGYEVVWPDDDARRGWPRRPAATFRWSEPAHALPAPAARICQRAEDPDLASVCALYERDRKALVELLRSGAERRFKERERAQAYRGGMPAPVLE